MSASISLAMAARDLSDLEIEQRIAGWIEFYRRSNHMTQAALALILGKPEGTISRVLRGERGCGADIWPLLRIKLHMDMNMMLDREPPALPEDRPLRSVPRPRKDDPPSDTALGLSSRSPAHRSGSGR